MKYSGYLSLLASSFTAAHALVATSWSVTNVPYIGLSDITFPITIAEADHIPGYYFAQQFQFVGVTNVGYTGIQPTTDKGSKAVLRGVFSSFIPGSYTTHRNCHLGADSGSGVSCAVEWNGVYGRQYDFEVKYAGNKAWVGTVVDSVTGERLEIGSYSLPFQALGIGSSQVGFIEWYPWNNAEPPIHCAHLPYQKTIFGNPTTTNKGSLGTQDLAFEDGDCIGQVAFHTAKVARGIEISCGFRGETGA